MKRHIIKTYNQNGIPSHLEISMWEQKHGLSINAVKLYVAYKVGNRRKIKRLRVYSYKSYPCELCGYHTYLDAVVGKLTPAIVEQQQKGKFCKEVY